jgi:hypothetical protein
MRVFRDSKGRSWSININVATIKRCRAMLGIDIYKLIDDGFKGLSELMADPCRLADVLYVLCKDEADKQNVTDEEFGAGLGGAAMAEAAEQFLEELIDFFPEASQKQLRQVVAKSRQVQVKMLERSQALLDKIDPEEEARKLASGSLLASSE